MRLRRLMMRLHEQRIHIMALQKTCYNCQELAERWSVASYDFYPRQRVYRLTVFFFNTLPLDPRKPRG